MVNYRRNFVPGGMYFFTVTLANRKSKILVDHVDLMRNAIRVARQERPSVIDAIVILPDHLHAIFMLPPDDSDFSGRWRRIKGHFSSALIDASAELKRRRTVVWRFGSGGSGSTPSATKEIFRGTSITFISIRSSMRWCSACAIGPTLRFIAM
jgi:REP element-mobilizing transposase RayT